MTTIPTYERLARVLEAEGLPELAKRARAGQFDDFDDRCESATPCIDLINALRAANRFDLAKRAGDGEWDGTREESEAWAARQTGDVAKAIRLMNKVRIKAWYHNDEEAH